MRDLPKGNIMNLSIRRGLFVFSLLAATAILAACGDELTCSSQETRQTIDQITRDHGKRTRFIVSDRVNVNLALNDIVTTDKKSAKTACKAKLTVTLSIDEPNDKGERSFDFNITYNVEKTDDGRLYVTVYGL